MWEELSQAPAQLILLVKIARRESNLYSRKQQNGINVSRCLSSLVKKGIIRKLDGSYNIIDPFFGATWPENDTYTTCILQALYGKIL